MSITKGKLKALFLLLCIVLVPLFLFITTVLVVDVVQHMKERYPEGKKTFQVEYLSGYMQDDKIRMSYVVGYDMMSGYTPDHQIYYFKMFNDEIGSDYYVDYVDGKVRGSDKEYINSLPEINDAKEFSEKFFIAEIDFSDYEMDIDFSNKLLEERQEYVIVSCTLKGEQQFVLKLVYCDKTIVFENVVVKYYYPLGSKNAFSEVLVHITAEHNGKVFYFYGNF